MKLIWKYIQPYKLLLFFAMILAAFNQGFSMLDPYFFGKLIGYVKDFSASNNSFSQNEFTRTVITYLAIMVGVAMVSRIAKAFQDYFCNVIIQKFGAKIYTDGIQQAMKLPFQKFEDQRSGETLSVLQKVKTDSEKFISLFINVFFISLTGFVIAFIYALRINIYLAPIYLISTLILGFLIQYLSKKIKVIQKKILYKTNVLAGSTTESLRNIELIKSLGLINQEVSRLNGNTYDILNLELEKVKKVRSLSFVQGTTINFIRQFILFILLMFIFNGLIEIENLITLQFFTFYLFGPLQELGNVILSYRETQASIENFDKLMNTSIEPEPDQPQQINQIKKYSFDKVSFKYQSVSEKSLDDISFSIEAGKTIAFVGPSGSGKTTLVKLLLGLYEPVDGKVLCNDIDIRKISKNDIRKQLGIVTQDPQLFSGKIRDNLQFVNPEATEEDMLKAMKMASADRILMKAGTGLDTIIGENGMKLSGGEKQRLAIARALLRDPSLLIFDEATSALDSLTEEDITNTIKHISIDGEKIVILIAHRLSTIMHADIIYVLEQGGIIEQGNHEALLEHKGLYYAMWRQQIGERKSKQS